MAQRIGARPEMADAHVVLGQAASMGGDAAAAAEHLGAAARILLASGALPALLDLLVDVAVLLMARGGDGAEQPARAEREWRQERALDTLAFALQQPALRGDTRARAEQCLAGAAHPYASETATRAQGLPLDEVVTRAIAAIHLRGHTPAQGDSRGSRLR
jgi:hypothetical protein